MRTLHSDLTAAQESASRTPYVKLLFNSRDRATTRTYTTTDGTNRVLFVEQSEGRWNGHIEAPDSNLPISVIVRLKDQDLAINVLDFIGYRLDIGWGYNTDSGDRFSEGPPSFIVEQRSFSVEGELVVELYGMSMWDMLRLAWSKQTITSIIDYDADVSILHIMMELLGGTSFKTLDGSGIEVLTGAVQLDDGGSFTDYTDEATNPTDGSDLGSTDDINLLPATPAVNDAFYIGHDDQFEHVSIDITTVGVGAYTGTWEIWTGSWVSLTVTDNTSSFKIGQLKTISFTKPTTWVTNTVNSLGPFYYVRFRVTGTGITTQPKATKVTVHHEFSVALDSSNTNQGDGFKPKFESDLNQNIVTVIRDILAPTLLVVRAEKDGFHVFFVDNTVTPIDYTYDTGPTPTHVIWKGVKSSSEILPNNIVATNLAPGEVGTRFSGTTGSNPSKSAFGTFTQILIDSSITSNSEAVVISSHATLRAVRNAAQGEVEAPNNVGQEVWDVVRVIDERSGQTYDGRVSQIIRLFNPLDGQYRIKVILGGAEISVRPGDIEEILRRHLFETREVGVEPFGGDTTGEFQQVGPVGRVPDLGRGDAPRGGLLQRGTEGPFDIITGRFGEDPRLPPLPFRLRGRFGGGAAFFPIGPIEGLPWRTDLWELFSDQPGVLPRRQTQPASGGYLSNTSKLLIQQIFVEKLHPRVSGDPIEIPITSGSFKAFEISSPDVAHGMTDFAPTIVGAAVALNNSTTGGAGLVGFDELAIAITLNAFVTNGSNARETAADGAILLKVRKKSGTGAGNMGANENLVIVRNNTLTRFILDSDGDSHQDVGTAWTNFDSHNDAVLLRDFAQAVSQDVRAGFGQFLAYNRKQLEKLGLVSFAGPTPFVNMSRLTMLHTGAIWQLHTRIESLEQELKVLRGGHDG